MFVILFWNNVFPYTIFGPLAPRYQTDGHFKACNKYWWSNLLYINNFYPENFNSSVCNFPAVFLETVESVTYGFQHFSHYEL